jgi:putative ABC transport system permease protein
MWEDLKSAFRALWASKTFTFAALGVLVLGIGATTAIFSVVDAVVLRGLPFDEHDRLVAVGQRNLPRPNAPAPPANADPAAVSSWAPQNYFDLAAQQQVFESIAAIAGGAVTLREGNGEPEEVRAQRVTADFFKVLRVSPLRGRSFSVDNEVDGRHRVAVLSDALWRRRFDADPDIVGKTIPLEGGAYEVLGVMPPDFGYPVGSLRPTELWVPYVLPDEEKIRNPSRMSIYLSAIARLKPGVTFDQAQANVTQIADALRQTHPTWNQYTAFGVRSLADHIVGARTQQWMLLLLGAVALVLLIACANVANLMLARASTREREIGIRAALGAGRWRLVRGLMVESLVLSLLGTALALVAAWWGISVLRSAMPDGVPRLASIAVDMRVLGVATMIAILTGLLFGAIPALQMTRPDLTNALKEGSRGTSASRSRQRMRSALVVGEVALAVVLLVGAALFIGSFRTLMKIDPGFSPENVFTAYLQPRVTPPAEGQPQPNLALQYQSIVDQLSTVPGVVKASIIGGGMPMGNSMSSTSIGIPGRELTGDDGTISIRTVTADYHDALRIPLRSGRLFGATDNTTGQPVIIINDLAAGRLFPGESAVGKTIILDGNRTVVGVVGTVYQSNLEREPLSEAYIPMPQAQGRLVNAELVIRTAGNPLEMTVAARNAVLSVLPDVPLRNVRSMEEVFGRQVAQRRLNMLLLGLFGVLGLVISAVGIYGVLAYLVAQRTREIGVRMALGASRAMVVRLVVLRAMALVVAGLVIGGAASWYLSGYARSFLFRMQVDDPRVYVTAVGSLVLAAFVASLIPAWRAASVSPTEALRQE